MQYNPTKSAPLLRVYTHTPTEIYPDGLAYAIHFAYSLDGCNFTPLHRDYGILFATAAIDDRNVICPKGAREPRIARCDGGFVITAIRTCEDGGADAENDGKVLCWTSADLCDFSSEAIVDASQAADSDTIELTQAELETLLNYWNPLENIAVRVPETVVAASAEDIAKIPALALYSDGSSVRKSVCWDVTNVDFNNPGEYIVTGTVKSPNHPFPFAVGYADPVILPWGGKYYYIATNDNLDDIGLYAREADTIEGLYADGVEEHLILPYDEARGFIQTFWAPEFHVIGGELYILFAVSGTKWGPQCHLMRLKKGGSIIDPAAWEDPIRVVKPDGTPLTTDAITLDMTYINTGDRSYMCWSYREHIGSPLDSGSMLMIAEADPQKPWQLASEPVLLSRPLFGWENVRGTINNEGPYAFVANDCVYLGYAAADARGYLYSTGLLTANIHADLTDPTVWKKEITPVVSFKTLDDRFGCGHHSFFVDDDGNLMFAYHAMTEIGTKIACDGMHRIHFDRTGRPRFDLAPENDLKPEFKTVTTKVIVK